jgi:hypothetical protein
MRSALRALLLAAIALAVTPARAGDGDDKKASEHKVTQSKSYLTIDPIYATIVAGDRPAGLLIIGIGIDVPDDKPGSQAQPPGSSSPRF